MNYVLASPDDIRAATNVTCAHCGINWRRGFVARPNHCEEFRVDKLYTSDNIRIAKLAQYDDRLLLTLAARLVLSNHPPFPSGLVVNKALVGSLYRGLLEGCLGCSPTHPLKTSFRKVGGVQQSAKSLWNQVVRFLLQILEEGKQSILLGPCRLVVKSSRCG